MLLNLLIHHSVLKELMCQNKYKTITLKLNRKMPDLPTLPTLYNFGKTDMYFLCLKLIVAFTLVCNELFSARKTAF